MQTAIQMTCTSGPSLRTLIADRAGKTKAWRVAEKTVGRNPGWMKIKSTERGAWGALNISWNSQTRTLTCRVVNKGDGTPHLIIGRFVDFLLEHYRKRIKLISIFEV